MTAAADWISPRGTNLREGASPGLILWGGAACCALVAHLAALAWIGRVEPEPPAIAREAALEVELSPIEFSAAESVASDAPAEPAVVEPVTDPVTPSPVAETVEAEAPLADAPIETAASSPGSKSVVAEAEVAEAEPVETPAAISHVAEPTPRRVTRSSEPARQAERPVRAKPTPPRRQARAPAPRRAQAQPQRAAPRAAASSASRASRAPTVSTADWQRRVYARVRNAARSARERGSVVVRFRVNTSGAISGAQVVRSSGKPELDNAALGAVGRASPVPPPPSGAGANVTIPIRFK